MLLFWNQTRSLLPVVSEDCGERAATFGVYTMYIHTYLDTLHANIIKMTDLRCRRLLSIVNPENARRRMDMVKVISPDRLFPHQDPGS